MKPILIKYLFHSCASSLGWGASLKKISFAIGFFPFLFILSFKNQLANESPVKNIKQQIQTNLSNFITKNYSFTNTKIDIFLCCFFLLLFLLLVLLILTLKIANVTNGRVYPQFINTVCDRVRTV